LLAKCLKCTIEIKCNQFIASTFALPSFYLIIPYNSKYNANEPRSVKLKSTTSIYYTERYWKSNSRICVVN